MRALVLLLATSGFIGCAPMEEFTMEEYGDHTIFVAQESQCSIAPPGPLRAVPVSTSTSTSTSAPIQPVQHETREPELAK